MRGDDGSISEMGPFTFHDHMLDLDCQLMTAADGIVRCLPEARYYLPWIHYKDAACRSPVAVLNSGYCAAPLYISTYATYDYCTWRYSGVRVYRLTRTLTNAYLKNGQTCTTATVSASESIYEIGEEVPLSTFVAFTKT
jgi:hypothetical protein